MKSKLLFAILTISLVLSCFAVSVNAGQYVYDGSPVCDGAELLTSSEENTLIANIETAKGKSGVDFYIYTAEGRTNEDEREDDLLLTFTGAGNRDSVILLIEKANSTYYYKIFTYGDAYSLLRDSDIDYILDDHGVMSNIKGGRAAAGSSRFIEITADRIAARAASSERTGNVLLIVIPIVLGLTAAGITVGVIIFKYKRKLKSPIYPLSKYAALNLTLSQDNYVTSHTVRTLVQSSSSSGGRSGGRSGGGGFRGGR